jgi:hypothetical protein
VQEILRQDGVWRIPTRLASQARQWTLKIIPARALQSAQYLLDTAYCLRLENPKHAGALPNHLVEDIKDK